MKSDLMTPGEVAELFRVDPKTVTRWAKSGRLASIRTLGGHRRYRRAEIDALLTKDDDPQAARDIAGYNRLAAGRERGAT